MEWAVLNWNEPAIGFYRSLGAGPLEEWREGRDRPPELDRGGRTDESSGRSAWIPTTASTTAPAPARIGHQRRAAR